MAPVFDQIPEDEGASLRLRQDELWQGSARHTDDIAPRDGDDSDDEDTDDEGYDSDDDEQKGQKQQGGGHKVQQEQGGGGGLLGINPLSPLSGVASGFASLIAPSIPPPPQLIRTSELPTSTASSPTASTAPSSSTSPSSTPSPTTLSLPTLSVNPVAVNNPQASVPQVVTMSTMTIMTTTSVATPSVTPSQSFINSIFPTMQTTTSPSFTPALENDLPSPTIFLTDTDNDYHHDSDSRDGSFSGPPPSGLSPTGEDVLISAGSIGKRNQDPVWN